MRGSRALCVGGEIGDASVATKDLIIDGGSNRHAVKHIVDKLVENGAVDGSECDGALMMKAAGAIVVHPAVHVSRLMVASEEYPLQGVKHLEAQQVAAGRSALKHKNACVTSDGAGRG